MKEQKHPHISRRSFLKISGGAAALTGVSLPKTLLAQTEEQLSTLIDLSLCDGCLDRETPACVSACKTIHNDKIPQVIENIPEPWPRRTIEDWSKKKEVSNRLTPYNLIYVHRADIDMTGQHKTLFVTKAVIKTECVLTIIKRTQQGGRDHWYRSCILYQTFRNYSYCIESNNNPVILPRDKSTIY